MSGLVYKVGDFEIDLMRVWCVDGPCVLMDDCKSYGVGTVVANAVRVIMDGQPWEPERPQGTCGTSQGACRGPREAPDHGPAEPSAVQKQPDSQSSVITSFPGDKAPEKDATTGTGGTTGTI